MSEYQSIIDAFKLAYENAGLLGGLGAGLTLLIRIYRLDVLQKLLPLKARWASFPGFVKVLLPVLLALAGSMVTAMAGGASVLTALIASIPVAIGAITGHHATKAAGAALDERSLRSNPYYEPARLRKAAALLLPLAKGGDDTLKP